MKLFTIGIMVMLQIGLMAQISPSSLLLEEELNFTYLEHLITNLTNEARVKKGREKLLPDSILFLAAQNHSRYLASTHRLTHFQKGNKSLRDPHLRAEFFGAHDFETGENIFEIPLGVGIEIEGKVIEPKSYEDYAKLIVEGWLISAPHRANIFSPDFNLMAISVVLDKKNMRLYVTQVFGSPFGEYEYQFSSQFFPYAELENEKKNFVFTPIKIKSVKKYPFGLKLPQSFTDCPPSEKKKWEQVEGNLTITRDKILMCIYDLNDLNPFFRSGKDGLAVELISFNNQFNCANEHEIKPNTRNGLSFLDGELQKPIYTKEILNQTADLREQANKRREKKDEKVCNYYELGKTPEGFTKYPYEVKLHYIRNKTFCTQVEFNPFCGQLLVFKPSNLPLKYECVSDSFKPISNQTQIHVKVGFEKNSVQFNPEELQEVIEQLKGKEYVVNSVFIQAYASVEGSLKQNKKLFEERAKVLVNAMENEQKSPIKYKLKTDENWEMFEKQLDTTEHFKMKNWSHEMVKEFFKDSLKAEQFEPFFKEQRKAHITLTITPVQNNKWKQLMAKSNWNELLEREFSEEQLNILSNVQCYLQKQEEKDSALVSPASLEIPGSSSYDLLRYRRKMYQIKNGKSYDPVLTAEQFKRWNKNLNHREADYNIKALIANNSDEFSAKEKIVLIRSLLAELKADGNQEELIADIELWYHIELANLVYQGQGPNFEKKAEASLVFIKDNYLKKDSSVERTIALAEFFIAFNQIEWAKELLLPLAEKDKPYKEALVLYLTHCMENELQHFPASYYAQIKKAHEILSEHEWCNLFIGPCKIPLKALDWPSLRSLYCHSCSGYISTSTE